MTEPEAPKEKVNLPRMTQEEMRKFVTDVLANQIFCLQDIPVEQQPQMFQMVFLAAAMGGLDGVDITELGTIYEYYRKALPTGVNGYPMFTSCRLMHKEDWDKAKALILELSDKQKEVIDQAFPKEK